MSRSVLSMLLDPREDIRRELRGVMQRWARLGVHRLPASVLLLTNEWVEDTLSYCASASR